MSKKIKIILLIIIVIIGAISVLVYLLNEYNYINIFASTKESNTKNVSFNTNFNLLEDQFAFIESENLGIIIKELSDSRCPVDTICVTPGTVEAKIGLSKLGRQIGEVTFSSHDDVVGEKTGGDNSKAKILSNYIISLVDVSPQGTRDIEDNKVVYLTLKISQLIQPVTKQMTFKTNAKDRSAKVIVTMLSSNIFYDEFSLDLDSNGQSVKQFKSTNTLERLYIKPKQYLSRKTEINLQVVQSKEVVINNFIAGDLSNDDIINSLDWSLMNSKWHLHSNEYDLTTDGVVNSLDWSLLNSNWNARGDGLIDGWDFNINI